MANHDEAAILVHPDDQQINFGPMRYRGNTTSISYREYRELLSHCMNDDSKEINELFQSNYNKAGRLAIFFHPSMKQEVTSTPWFFAVRSNSLETMGVLLNALKKFYKNSNSLFERNSTFQLKKFNEQVIAGLEKTLRHSADVIWPEDLIQLLEEVLQLAHQADKTMPFYCLEKAGCYSSCCDSCCDSCSEYIGVILVLGAITLAAGCLIGYIVAYQKDKDYSNRFVLGTVLSLLWFVVLSFVMCCVLLGSICAGFLENKDMSCRTRYGFLHAILFPITVIFTLAVSLAAILVSGFVIQPAIIDAIGN
jgi:hypothetical protein